MHTDTLISPGEFVNLATKDGMFAFDIEHHPDFSAYDSDFKLLGCGFATGDFIEYVTDFDWIAETLKRLFKRPELDAIAYNGKYDVKCLVNAGILDVEDSPVDSLCDPMVAINLLDENRKPGNMGLKVVIKDLFGTNMKMFMNAWSYGPDSYEFKHYAKDDVRQELKLWKYCKPKLESEGLTSLFRKILMPVSCIFSEMESTGIFWDLAGARRLMYGFQKLRDQMEKEIFKEIGVLNINSGDQVAKRLFDDLGYSTRGVPMTDSGKRLKVDAPTMDKLAQKYEICDKIRAFRTASKMINTYIEPLTRKALDDPKGRIHPTFWIISATGRTRCEQPNFQNIPAWITKRKGFEKLDIRSNVIAEPGHKLIIADLSQIELRLAGHISQDPKFLRSYLNWTCTHCGAKGSSSVILHECPDCHTVENEDVLTGAIGFWHGLDLHQQTFELVPATEDRQGAKTANFMLIYLGGAYRAHHEYPKLSVRQWEDVIEGYFSRDAYYGVHEWHVRMEHAMKTTGVCTDVFGRKRRISKRDMSNSYKHALNMFVNFPPQSSACGLIELSMVKMREDWLKEGSYMRDIFPINFVHDEIVLEVKEELADEYAIRVRDHMELSANFTVPIRADVHVADQWGKGK